MKESIKILIRKIEKYTDAKFKTEDDYLEVIPQNNEGFPVGIYDCGNELTVSYGGWHTQFTDQNEALDCFVFALSKQCRLEVYFRGSYEYKWTVQHLDNEKWNDVDTTVQIFVPFWRPKYIKYLQNTLWEGI